MQGMKRLHSNLQRRPRRRQAGITTLGIVFLTTFIGMFAFGAIRLIPVYLNYMKIVGVINGVVAEFDTQNATRLALRRSIGRRLDVESVGLIHARDITVTTVNGGLQVSAVYDHTTPFIGHISFTVHFDKTEIVRR